MTDDEAEIRGIIERWIAAIQTCDHAGVQADHTDDLVMFDVPPPYDGVRGAAAYRDTWPPFFEYIDSGATFELLELDVTAGDSVAYAYGLLRCGTAEDFSHQPRLPAAYHDGATESGRPLAGRPRTPLGPDARLTGLPGRA